MNYLLKMLITAVAVLICSYTMPGVHVQDFFTAIIVAVVLSFLNSFIKPILILLTIPITIFTLGLFLLVINAIIIIIAAKLINGFQVDGFWWAIGFSIILALVNSFVNSNIGNNR
jgi:putative membrane protein